MTTKSFTTDLVVDSAVADDLIAVLASASDVDRQLFVTAFSFSIAYLTKFS